MREVAQVLSMGIFRKKNLQKKGKLEDLCLRKEAGELRILLKIRDFVELYAGLRDPFLSFSLSLIMP